MPSNHKRQSFPPERDWGDIDRAPLTADNWGALWRNALLSPINSVSQAVRGLSIGAYAGSKWLVSTPWRYLTGKGPRKEGVMFGRVHDRTPYILSETGERHEGIPSEGQHGDGWKYTVILAGKDGKLATEDVYSTWDHKPQESVIFFRDRRGTANRIYRTQTDMRPTHGGISGADYDLSMLRVASIVDAQYERRKYVGEWERVEIASELKEYFPQFPSAKCGLYQHRVTGAGVLVFNGTNPLSIPDHIANIQFTNGKITKHHQFAPAIVTHLKARYPELLVAGHSKGGGMAQFAAILSDTRCVCLNSVGVPSAVIDHMKGRVGQQALDKMFPGGDVSKAMRSKVEEEEFLRRKKNITHYMVEGDLVSNIAGLPRGVPRNPTGVKVQEGMTTSIAGPVASFLQGPQSQLGEINVLPTSIPLKARLQRHYIRTLSSSFKHNECWLENPFTPSPSHKNDGSRINKVPIEERTTLVPSLHGAQVSVSLTEPAKHPNGSIHSSQVQTEKFPSLPSQPKMVQSVASKQKELVD